MRRRTGALVLAVCILAGIAPWTGGATVDAAGSSVTAPAPERVIVHLTASRDTVRPLGRHRGFADTRRIEAVRSALEEATAALAKAVPSSDLAIHHSFRLQPAFVASVTPGGMAALIADPRVRAVEPDRRLTVQTQQGLEMIGADILHRAGIAGDGTAVAIIDSGVDYLHPTLGGGQIPNAKVVFGRDLADGDEDPMDCDGHGTAVASVAAGSSYQWGPNRRFAGGVAPAAKILAYKVTPDDDCRVATTSTVVAAIEDAVLRRDGDDYRLAAVNISLGGGAFSGPCDHVNLAYATAIEAAVEAGVVVVTAAGNEGLGDSLNAPACLTRTIAVGAAWDENPGLIGYRFCLDPQCTRSCDDSFRWRGAVACYSNSDAYLDLLAPSEYLRAAASGGVTFDFGGTSGAAAYVTGAAALLAEAAPGIDPNAVRFLLAATGRPTMDDKNGLVRPIVDLASAVEAGERVAVAEEGWLGIAADPATPTVSSLFVDRIGVVGHLEVLLDLAHPRPESLRIVLRAPDGTAAVLHDGGPGTTPDWVGGDRFDGIAGSYPNDLEPRQSLGRFAGVGTNGWWTLTVEDGSDPTGGSGDPRLLGWALKLTDPSAAPFSDTTMVYPVVARVEGAYETEWRSDLRIFNRSGSHDSEISLFLVPASGETFTGIRQAGAIVPHGSVLALDDVVGSRFGLQSAQGNLLVQDPSGLVAHGTSRTYTIGDSGTFGQFIAPIVGDDRSTGAGEPPLVLLPTPGDDQRVNIGCTEIAGAAVTVAVTLIDSVNGVALAPSSFLAVAPHENLQINGILPNPDLATADPYLTVTVVHGEGRVTAYASVIDNRSGDAIFTPGAAPQVTSSLVIPVVAKVRGHAGTDWRSDLRVLNHGSFSVHVDAELRFQGAVGVPPVTESFELRPGEAAAIVDVVGQFFGFDEVLGSLRLIPREGPAALCAASRTANIAADGTYGQYVPVVAGGTGLRGRGTLLHLEKSSRARSNIGIVEIGGKPITVQMQLVDELGRPIGLSRRLLLGPWDSVQINDVFTSLDVQPQDNARLELDRESGAGSYFAYASVIDVDSGDAIFVPVLEIAN